jgi:NMD protein affecting ribosome stability and mRNA decay
MLKAMKCTECGRSHEEELHNLCSPENVIRVIKSREMGQAIRQHANEN